MGALLCILISVVGCLTGLAAADSCRGTITLSSGITAFASSNYPNSYEDYTFCRYVVEGPTDRELKLTFTGEFDVEAGEDVTACADKVGIFDPESPAATSDLATPACRNTASGSYTFGPFCGQTRPEETFTMSGNRAVVEFCTDQSVGGKGWNISVEYAPLPTNAPWTVPEITLDKVAGVHELRSPNYPFNYNNRQTVQYIIRNPNRDWIIQLTTKLFDLGGDGGDRLTVHDVTNNVIRTYYGIDQSVNELDYLEIANSELVHINFTTNAVDTYRGFLIQVTSMGCAGHLLACDDFNGCYHPNASCNGVNECADGSDEKWEYCAPECGVNHVPLLTANALPATRVVGGVIANKHSIPWQATLTSTTGNLACGGTIISDRWILSAAHCFRNRAGTGWNPPSMYRIKVGSQSLGKTAEADGGLTFEVEQIICHPYYTPQPADHDICLLKLAATIPFRKNIIPACLPRQGEPIPPAGTQCLTSGWGTRRYSSSAPVSTHLRQVFVPVVDQAECNRAYQGRITERMMCSGTVAGGLDTCQGDSGGPYVCPMSDGRWQVSGVVSFGAGCGDPGVPGVYAKTSYFTHWIVDQIASN